MLFGKIADMIVMTGLTLTEIAEALGIDKWAAEKRLRKAKVEKLTREALYPLDAIERIKDWKQPGRPKKAVVPAEPTKSKKVKKAK